MQEEFTILEPRKISLRDALASTISQLSPRELTIFACTVVVSGVAMIAYVSSCGRTISLGNGLLEIT